jgi:hypothetical protein
MKYWKLTLRDRDLGLEEAEYLEFALQHKGCCWVDRRVFALPASKPETYNIFALFSTADGVGESYVVCDVQLTYHMTIIPAAKQPPQLALGASKVHRMVSLEVISEDSYKLTALQSLKMSCGERKPLVYECKESERDRKPPERIACHGFSTRFYYERMQVFPWPPHPDACHCNTCDPAGN